jgi:peptidoglycan/LPS O-acetylase OafA/YrhL
MTQRNINLDVLRMSAIVLVFLAHSFLAFEQTSAWHFIGFGGVGVDLFFILSGWLIGSQIFKEIHTYGNLQLRRFWSRRWMRTMPAYFAVLFATYLQFYLFNKDIGSVAAYLTFTQNYFTDLPYFYVSWSLAVEEQFYVFIGALLFISTGISKHLKTMMLLGLLLLPSLFRALGWYDSMTESHVRWDCCIAGVLLAQLQSEQTQWWSRYKSYALKLAPIALGVFLLFFAFRVWPPAQGYQDPSKFVLALLFSFFIVYAYEKHIAFPQTLQRIILYISTRSYAIYLLHPEILALSRKVNIEVHFVFYTMICFALTLLVSEVLYRIIELPLMQLREKFSFSCSRKSANRSADADRAVI